MELRHYRYFLAAAEELNISRASRRLNVSQPAMSRLIRDLENELGRPLFKRERFGLTLTSAGEKLLAYARRILDLNNEAARSLRDQPDEPATITVGFITSSLGFFLGTVTSFRESYPGLTVKTLELSPADQVKALRNGQIDVALLGNPSGMALGGLETRALFEMKLEAVLPASHRLAAHRRLRLKELEQEDFIGYNEESFPGRNQTITNACRVAGFEPALHHRANSLAEVLAMVGSGFGVCLMPTDVASLPHPNSVFLSIREKLEPIRFTAAWRRHDGRPVIDRLVESLRRCSGDGP